MHMICYVDTPMVSGPSKDVATALGMVPMSRCVSAYMHVIEDETLNGKAGKQAKVSTTCH